MSSVTLTERLSKVISHGKALKGYQSQKGFQRLSINPEKSSQVTNPEKSSQVINHEKSSQVINPEVFTGYQSPSRKGIQTIKGYQQKVINH